MSEAAIDIWADNDREITVGGVKKATIVAGKLTITVDNTIANISAFLSTIGDSSGTPIAGTTVTALSSGDGKYTAFFDAVDHFSYATLAPYFDQTIYCNFKGPGNFFVAQPVKVLAVRPAK